MKHKLHKLLAMLAALFIVALVSQCKKEEPLSSFSKVETKNGGPYIGVINNNGILEFNSRAELEVIYDQLEIEVANDTTADTTCLSQYPVLDNFETQLGFTSIRREFELNECNELAQGKDPMDIEELFILDPILATFINSDQKVIMEDTAYYWFGDNIIYYTPKENISSFDDIDAGMHYVDAGVELMGEYSYKKGPCNVQVEITNIDFANKSVTATYTGSGVTSHEWTSLLQKKYGSQVTFTYTTGGVKVITFKYVCDNGTPSDPTDDFTGSITRIVDLGSCNPDFTYTVTANNIVYFNDASSTTNGPITSWEWTFAGGTPNKSYVQNPPPVDYGSCNGDKTVTLEIKSADCPNGESEEKTIEVSASYCCDRDPQLGWKELHYTTGKKIKYCYKMSKNFLGKQCLVAKLKHYKEGPWWNPWKLDKADLDIDFSGNTYKIDHLQCSCKNSHNLTEYPAKKDDAKTLTVSDELARRNEPEQEAKKTNPFHIIFKVNGTTVLDLNIDGNGLGC